MKEKVAVITGASSGIGKALAFEFAARGAHLVLAARSIQKLKEIANAMPNNEVLCVETDISNELDCKDLINKTLGKFHGIDILINNAGISMRALFADTDIDVMKQLMDVNFWGAVYCTHYALPYLIESSGSVVGINSIAGFIGLPGRAGYSASKFALRGFLDTLRVENLHNGLHVLNVAPGFTASNVRKNALTAKGTKQGESPRDEDKMMSAEECAKRIANAVKYRKRELILTFKEGKLSVFLSKVYPKLMDSLSFNHMAKEENSPIKK
ncbi:MAG: SDR family oxidoreductase [Bacteroidales bacterium]